MPWILPAQLPTVTPQGAHNLRQGELSVSPGEHLKWGY